MKDPGSRLETDAERAFRVNAAALRAREPDWLKALREEAIDKFEGLPDRHQEEFHYTDLHARLRAPSGPSAAPPSMPRNAAFATRLGASVISIIGDLVEPVASGAPLRSAVFTTLRDAIAKQPDLARKVLGADTGEGAILDGLGAALATDGAILRLTNGAVIVLDHCAGPSAVHLRHKIVVEARAHVTLIELHSSLGDSLAHVGMQIDSEPGARLDHVKLITQGGTHLSGVAVHLGAAAQYDLTFVALGTVLIRQSLEIGLEGEGAIARVHGALLVAGEEHSDLHAAIGHTVPNCISETEVRAVAADRGRAAVQSLVRVAPNARASDGRQLIRGLILGERAEIDAKPELEILNDDVKCSHGTALGDLDAEAIFYLRARGIPEREARSLLVEAFIAELLERVPQEGARNLLHDRVRDWLARSLASEAPHG